MQQSKKTQGGGRATKPAAISKKATRSLRAASTPSSKSAPRSMRQTAAENGKSDSRVSNKRALKDGSEMGRQGTRFDGGILKNRSGAGGKTQPGGPALKEQSGKTAARKNKPVAKKGSDRTLQASKSSKGTSSKRAKSGK